MPDSVIVSREEQMYGGNWQRLKQIKTKYDPGEFDKFASQAYRQTVSSSGRVESR